MGAGQSENGFRRCRSDKRSLSFELLGCEWRERVQQKQEKGCEFRKGLLQVRAGGNLVFLWFGSNWRDWACLYAEGRSQQKLEIQERETGPIKMKN